MTALRKIVVLVFLAVFVAAFVLAALGSTKKIELTDGALTGFFAVLVVQGIAAIVAAFRTPDFFKEEHKTIAELERRHAEAMAQKDAQHRHETDQLTAQHKQAHGADAIVLLKEKKEKLGLARELACLRNPLPTVSGSEISSEEFKRRDPDDQKKRVQ